MTGKKCQSNINITKSKKNVILLNNSELNRYVVKDCYPPATSINTLMGAIPIYNKSDRNGKRQFTRRESC